MDLGGHTSLFCALPPLQDDDNDNKDSEYSTDDVDSEEESQILVPISRGKGSDCCVDVSSNGVTCMWFCADNNARRNNWYVDAEISEIVDEVCYVDTG